MIINSNDLLAYFDNANDPVIGWRNSVTIDNVTADSEDEDYPAVNLGNPNTASVWVSGHNNDQYITVLLGAESADYLAVAKHNFGTIGAVLSVEGRASAMASFSSLVAPTTVDDDLPIIFRFPPHMLHEIRLKIAAGGSGLAVPRAAVLYVGTLLVLQRRIYVGHTPITMGRRVQVTTGRSESGNYLGRIVTGEHRETAVSLQNLTPSWYRTNFDPFVEAALADRPFFFAWRPGGYPLEVGFAWLTNEPRPVNQRNNGMMQVDLQMNGIA